MKVALEHYSLAELTQLIKAAERRLKELAKRRPVAQVRRELALLAAKNGYTIEQVLDTPTAEKAIAKRRKRKPGKVAPKYRDPGNPRNTWSGRGSQPRWLAEKVKRGHSPADCLIPGLAKPTAKQVKPGGQRTLYKANAG
ncbi:H-NS histone family protein [Lysobacter maris]|uniref:H-NS histone family protein n=1 Tax=Marilutibacter maris TaxID=1605891 RepID=A0A508B936_9GAMM|nr:H-NS histone family protein [Lysobacter maris]KAB8198747.1 H-NS histone family protein [Lysobacter maris]